jgi:hypothetical protein
VASSLTSHEGYARLPEDLLRDLLSGAADMMEEVRSILIPSLEHKDALRQALNDLKLIRTFEENAPVSICGVDGGFAVERTSVVDIALAVAVGVEGLSTSTTSWNSTQYGWWSRILAHAPESERLARGVMVAEELNILANAPHKIRILDGSHLTLVIQLNSALTAFSDELRSEAKRVWERLLTVEALTATVNHPGIVAMPKFDSSRTISDLLEKELNIALPGDDKQILTLLLRPGELLVPQQVPQSPWDKLHLTTSNSDDAEISGRLDAAIAPLRNRDIYFTYFKPDEFAPAFRIEIKDSISLDDLCATLSTQITGPFIREPYPQYLADVMAKSVGLGLSALQAAVQLALSRGGSADIAEMLIRSYRTEGV